MGTHKGMPDALLTTMWHIVSPTQPGAAHKSGLPVFIPAPKAVGQSPEGISIMTVFCIPALYQNYEFHKK